MKEKKKKVEYMYAGVYWRFLTAVPEKHEMTARHKMIVYLQKKKSFWSVFL